MATGLYHSKLVPLGPVWATITTDWKQSKDKNSMYCGMTINAVEYWYTAESQACQDALNGFAGRTILIQAAGSRENATIEVLEEQAGGVPRAAVAPRPAAAPVARPAPQRAVSPIQARPTPPAAHSAPALSHPAPPAASQTPEAAIAEATSFLQRNRLLLELCSYEAGKLAEQYNTVVMKRWIEAGVIPVASPEQIQSWTSCLFIEANKAGLGRSLPDDAQNDQPPM